MSNDTRASLDTVATHSMMIHIADGEMPEISIHKMEAGTHTVDIDYRGGRITMFIDESFDLEAVLKMLSQPRVVS